MILSGDLPLYNINLRATTTTILSTRGVMIPIDLVSSAMDSIRRCVVLFKPVPILTSDPKSEFLYQSSLHCAEPTDPPNTLYTWDISHALTITYHPYCHSPSALTEYLEQKLHAQHARHLSHSLPAQVEQDVPLKHNTPGGSTWLVSIRNAGGVAPPCPSGVSTLLCSSGMLCLTWARWLQLQHFACCTWSLHFRYSVRAVGLWA